MEHKHIQKRTLNRTFVGRIVTVQKQSFDFIFFFFMLKFFCLNGNSLPYADVLFQFFFLAGKKDVVLMLSIEQKWTSRRSGECEKMLT